MDKSLLIGILYVSVWVLIWGTLGSLIDYPLLQQNVYSAGSFGQYITFSLSGVASVILGVFFFNKTVGKSP